MNNIKLTKKSFDNLINKHIGAGKVFIHTGKGEVTSWDFWLGRFGNFYTFPARLLSDALAEEGRELHRQEQEQDK